jgi:hypothetical protein
VVVKKQTKQTPRPVVTPAEAPRNYGPRGIAGLIAPLTRPAFKRRAPAAATLFADWPVLAGPDLARCAAPVKFSGGTLTLGCQGPAALELQMAQAQIISRLNMALGAGTVERLRFVQQVPRPLPTPPARAVRQDVRPPDGLPPGELGEALARFYQGLMSRER